MKIFSGDTTACPDDEMEWMILKRFCGTVKDRWLAGLCRERSESLLPLHGIAVRLKVKISFLPQRGCVIKLRVAAKAATLRTYPIMIFNPNGVA